MKTLTLALVLFASTWAHATTIPFGVDRGGTGPYYLTYSTTGTWNKITVDIDLSKIAAQTPANQPVPYAFIGMHGTSGWNAESGFFIQNGKAYPFTFRAPGNVNGSPLTRWYQPSGGGYNLNRTLRLSFVTNNGSFTSTITDLSSLSQRSWTLAAADGAGFSALGTNQFGYRELAYNTFENQWSATNYNGYYLNAEFFNSQLCNNSGCASWTDQYISIPRSSYWFDVPGVLTIWQNADGSRNGASFRSGIYLVPEPGSAIMLLAGLIPMILWNRKRRHDRASSSQATSHPRSRTAACSLSGVGEEQPTA